MPTYRNSLPPIGKHQGFDLRRTPETGALQAICTCEDFLVCDTHYYRGRTSPCERIINDKNETIDDSTCPACLDKCGYRTHVYVSVFDAKKSEHFIFECTANAAKSLEEYRNATGTLRGCVIYANRPKGTKNGRVVIVTNTVNQSKVRLPTAPDLVRALAVIWRLPGVAIESKPDAKKNGHVKINNKRMKEIMEQPDNMPEPLTAQQLVNDINRACGVLK